MSMKKAIMLIAAIGLAIGSYAQIAPGYRAPGFELKNVDGKMLSLKDGAGDKGAIVIFTCNTCPVSQAYEQRIIELDNKYRNQGYPVIAINPNDPEVSPGDSFENMQKRANDKNFPFPYLFDEGQNVFPAYGATRTPHVYLLKRDGNNFTAGYVGAIDDNQRIGDVEEKFLENAISALLSGKTPEPSETVAVGCGIKVKKKN